MSLVKTVAVLVIFCEALSDKLFCAVRFEKLVIEPLFEVNDKLFEAIISEKFLLTMSLFAVIPIG